MASSSKTTLWGKPILLVQVTVSPDLMVISAGSNTSAPPAAPRFTLAALAESARPRDAMPTPAAVAYLQQGTVTRQASKGGLCNLRNEAAGCAQVHIGCVG